MTKLDDLTTTLTTSAEEHELVPAADPRAAFLSINPHRLGGVPVFKGTRVPCKYLFDYLQKGMSVEAFLDDFEGVPRDEALAALQMGCEKMLEGLPRL